MSRCSPTELDPRQVDRLGRTRADLIPRAVTRRHAALSCAADPVRCRAIGEQGTRRRA